ncbi:hypothetical protein HIMB100_00000070 [SAR116 cluster alpha proteobacterium HIMB100]|nr:hypothetical protein HIMB100_00000070 [SAR116 cluster alpha proteobacterium HIMB100]
MTDIQLPDSIRDLFAAFDIADSAQILVLLLGAVLALLLVLIILIAVRGRSAPAAATVPASASVPDKTEPPVLSSSEPAFDKLASAAPAVEASPALPETEQLEDFRIFKRPKAASAKPVRTAPVASADENLSTTEHLQLIEKNMIRLRDLYQGGHITRDMYVDETRSLYHQARGLSSIS